jgi:hypothetical protein
MKKKMNITAKISILLLTGLLIGGGLFAQTPPQPPQHRRSGSQSGGGFAPLGEGVALLLSLGSGYGIFKLKRAHHKNSRRKGETQNSLLTEIHDPFKRVD